MMLICFIQQYHAIKIRDYLAGSVDMCFYRRDLHRLKEIVGNSRP